ncbi:MAG: HAD family hydrolase [Planctomycetes bacterium]|nr:HAD family hydrolase [Planctomycetota bacterium]MCB9918084.1 HAD family hydrolase [Planctomycetota bacterium]
MSSRAVFLDRDGVLNEERGFVTDVADFVVQKGVAAALERLGRCGYRRIVVTNQSGVGRGLISLGALERIHCALREATGGIDALYFCPHHPDAAHGSFRTACNCRKPGSGMLIRAARDLDLDLAASWMVGDAPRDIVAGQRVGCRTICVTGPKMPSSHDWPADSPKPETFVSDLGAAVDYILATP